MKETPAHYPICTKKSPANPKEHNSQKSSQDTLCPDVSPSGNLSAARRFRANLGSARFLPHPV